MPIDPSQVLRNIRLKAGLEDTAESLIQMDTAEDDASQDEDRESFVERAGESYDRLISVCFAGIGTCGVNILMSLKEKNPDRSGLVNFLGINSDGASIAELKKRGFNNNIALSHSDSNYLGAGGDLETAKKMGERYYDDFKERFKNVDLVLVVTGMGGGTGTGVAPFVAKAAKEVQDGKRNTLTIGVAAMPSGIEADRCELAMQGIEELRKYVDALIVIDQMNILDVLEEENASADQAEELIDSRFQIVLQSIMDTVTTYTKRNIDFADVCSTLKTCGDAIITTVEADSENTDNIKKVLEKAINDKLLINHSNKTASRLLIYHFYEKGYSERKHYEVVGEVQKLFGWTKGSNGFYSCVIEHPSENAVKFLKISGDSSDDYRGKNKVIVMAGGFEAAPPRTQIQATQRMQAAAPPPAAAHAAPQHHQTQYLSTHPYAQSGAPQYQQTHQHQQPAQYQQTHQHQQPAQYQQTHQHQQPAPTQRLQTAPLPPIAPQYQPMLPQAPVQATQRLQTAPQQTQSQYAQQTHAQSLPPEQEPQILQQPPREVNTLSDLIKKRVTL